MKITRFSQNAQTPQSADLKNPSGKSGPLDPKDQKIEQDIQVAYQKVINAIGVINESLRKIEESGAGRFFDKKSLIDEIQSGRIDEFDINKANDALEAMKVIVQASQMLNSALYFLKQNENASSKFKVDIQAVMNNIVADLNAGNYANLVSGMEYIKSSLTQNTGTINT